MRCAKGRNGMVSPLDCSVATTLHALTELAIRLISSPFIRKIVTCDVRIDVYGQAECTLTSKTAANFPHEPFAVDSDGRHA